MSELEKIRSRHDKRRGQGGGYDEAIARSQSSRESQVSAALAVGATYLTLMSASATGRAADIDPERLQSAQLLLSLLFAGTLGYYLTGIANHSMSIVDNAARRKEIEDDD